MRTSPGRRPRCASFPLSPFPFALVALPIVAVALSTSCSVFPDDAGRGPLGQRPSELPHAGSGVIVGDGGYVLTHGSVIAGADSIVVESCLQERRTRVTAALVRVDARSGLALLRAKGVSDWVLPWRGGRGPSLDSRLSTLDSPVAIALGWPLLGASASSRHEIELAACSGTVTGEMLSYPLGPGYEGGPVVDGNGDGLGILAEAGSPSGAEHAARIVPADQVRAFLKASGTEPRAAVGKLRRDWRTRLAQLQNSTVQIERTPPRNAAGLLPRLAWRSQLLVDEISDIEPLAVPSDWQASYAPPSSPQAPGGDPETLSVRSWSARDGAQLWPVSAQSGVIGTPSPVPGIRPAHRRERRRLVTGHGAYTLDSVGLLRFEPMSAHGSAADLTLLNGLRRFRTGGALEASQDGSVLLVGDAVVWTASNTVLWRLAIRPGDPARLLPDASAIVIGRNFGERRRHLELWRLPLSTSLLHQERHLQ